MKKIVEIVFSALFVLASVCGCGTPSELDPQSPVTLTMWHVYGEQADSPMNRLVEEFNRTVGREKGIVINVTMMTNAREIGALLTSAQQNKPGAPQMPDLFSCHSANIATLGADTVLDWSDYFSRDEINGFVSDFIKDGMVEGKLCVLPVSKSTFLLFVNGSQFQRFSAETGVAASSLSTWSGLFAAAEKYYAWSGGKPMCALDYLLRDIELNAQAQGAQNLFAENGWYDVNNPLLKQSYLEFIRPLVQGHITVSDLYSNTQIMTGETLSGIGSSAAILYYNDVVTYPDNTTEPTNLQILPYPRAARGKALMTQAGVGLGAYKTTTQKAEAASVFAHWLTEPERNLEFVVQTGYMPVRTGSFDAIDSYSFPDASHKALYDTLDTMRQSYASVSEADRTDGYYEKTYRFYDQLRQKQTQWKTRFARGESVDVLMEEAWQLFCNIQ